MYPVVNAGRVVQSFNDGWYYVAYNDNRFQKVRCHEEGWEQVHLPHTWNTDAYSTRNYRRASSWYKKDMTPSFASLEKICDAFGITLSQFFADGEESVVLTPSQRKMLDKWNCLTEAQHNSLLILMDSM